MKIIALWCHPRSASTAFERVMRERGDFDVLHEPFMYHYYLSGGRRLFAGFDPEADHPTDYAGIRDMICARAADKPVFFKDMAYYVTDDLPGDPEFAARVRHVFLIRDPAESILSYHRRDPEFSLEEVGIEAQWKLFSSLRAGGAEPVVLRARDFRANPGAVLARLADKVGIAHRPEALSWRPGVPRGWRSVAHWHDDVIRTHGVLPPEPVRDYGRDLAALGARYVAYERHHRPFFDALAARAEIL